MISSQSEKLLRIAVVEDDLDLLNNTLEYLHAQGYSAWGVGSAEAFYKRFAINAVEVVVLDIGLPGEDGISVANHLRELPQLMVIIVSARNAVDDRLAGLSAGADRYLVKPVDFAELVANIEAVGRRSSRTLTVRATERRQEKPTNLQLACWHLKKQDWCLIAPDGIALTLTSHEYVLLNCLFEAKGEIVSKKTIADKIFGAHAPNSRERLDVQLARLRKKAALAFGYSLPIKTLHLKGYAFTATTAVE
ncbi:MAG: response regulator transcription factor [Gallionellaceae bacterium]|jgi:DNA-binding response OmpR family regulator